MKNYIAGFFLLVFMVLSTASAIAQQADQKYVDIRLIPERSTIEPGETIWIGIEQKIAKKWHTYWINPGDSGEPTRIKWNVPNGFEVSDIEWPVPHKISMGALTNYGYEDKIILLQQLTAPRDLPEGSITLEANIELLVCEDICIPEFGTYGLILNDDRGEDNTEAFDEFLNHLPYEFPWKSSFYQQDENLYVSIDILGQGLIESIDQTKPVHFFPYDWGIIENSANPDVTIDNGKIVITQQRGDRPLAAIENLRGLIAYYDTQGQYGAFKISATPANIEDIDDADEAMFVAETKSDTSMSVAVAILFAFLGGFILNLMPCVFPILSMKALSLCNMQGSEKTQARKHGVFYTLGILVCFGVIAGLLISLKAGGEEIGWGFQLQNPGVVLFLSWLLFAIGLNLSGFFDFKTLVTEPAVKPEDEHTASGSFFTGVLATLVATPCTAPFMGVALGYALVQPAAISMIIFLSLGLGLAFPYLFLSFVPSARAFLPKPGIWMEYFKQFLAFPMFASAAWLVWVYANQAGDLALLKALLGMILIAFWCWVIKIAPEKGIKKITSDLVALIVLISVLYIFIVDVRTRGFDAQLVNELSDVVAEDFTVSLYEDIKGGDEPLFVNMTADWCITCKVNESVALNTPTTKMLFKDRGIRYLKGDWTNQNEEITKYLDKYGRNGVPIYVYYGPRSEDTKRRPDPKILPQILTPGIIADIIKNTRIRSH